MGKSTSIKRFGYVGLICIYTCPARISLMGT
jgi:hypothetical protein